MQPPPRIGSSPTLQRWLPPIVLLIASWVVFGRGVVSDQAFFARDVMNYYWPTRQVAAESYRAWEIPQWDPSHQSGVPLLGDIHAAVLYPPNLLYQVLSFPRAYGWLVLLHHFAAGLGLCCFLRRLGFSILPALLGALSFLLSGYLVGLANAGPLMAGAAYVPWVLVALSSARPAAQRVALIGVLVALQSLTGDPQSVVFSALAGLLFTILGSDRRGKWNALLGGFTLAAVLSAVQLLPAAELLGLSTRSNPGQGFFRDFAFHPARIAELFFSFPFGRYTDPPFFWAHFAVRGPGALPFALSGYLGISALFVAVLGIQSNRQTALALALFGVGLLFALGPYGPAGALLASVPPFRYFRYCEKYLYLASLGFGVAVASGMARVWVEKMAWRRLWALLAAVTLLGLCILVASTARDPLLQWGTSLLQSRGVRAQPSQVLDAALYSGSSALLWAGLAVLVLVLLQRQKHPIYRWLLLAVVSCDLLLAARPVVWTAPKEIYQVTPAAVAELQRHSPVHPFRYFRDLADLERKAPGELSLEGRIARRAWELGTLKSNFAGAFGLEETSGYGAVSLARWDKLALSLYDQPAKLAAIFGACLALSSDGVNRLSAVGFRQVSSAARLGLGIFLAPTCTERLRTVQSIQRVGSLEAGVEALRQSEVDLSKTAFVEGEDSRIFQPAELSNIQVEPRRAAVRVVAPESGAFVVFATSHYPGWSAHLDGGREDRLRIVNTATMGAWVPPGTHTLEFRFAEPMLITGAVISFLGVIITVWMLLAAWVKKDRVPPSSAL